jgi:hypothetical protein
LERIAQQHCSIDIQQLTIVFERVVQHAVVHSQRRQCIAAQQAREGRRGCRRQQAIVELNVRHAARERRIHARP